MPQPLKSVKVDYNTWRILTLWAQRESRTVMGQLRHVTQQSAPEDIIGQVQMEAAGNDHEA